MAKNVQTALDRLQELTFTPDRMTALHWMIWNARASLPLELLEQAAQQLEEILENNNNAGMYYTPKHIADISTGSGSFLKQASDDLSSPPYQGKNEK